jgi:hypothetical protein
VASLTGWVPAGGLEGLEELRLLGAAGVLSRTAAEPTGRFLLEVSAQVQPTLLELAYRTGMRLRTGPYLLGPGVRLEAESLELPTNLAPRRGQLSLLRSEPLELLEVYGNRLLLQSIQSAADGGFEFLAARAGPFELRSAGGGYWQISGPVAADPLRFVPWQPSVAESLWQQLAEPWAKPQTPSPPGSTEHTGSGQVVAQVFSSDGQGVAGVRMELSLEVLWSPPEDPERPPIPINLQFETHSDAQGRLRWEGLPAGKARLVMDGNLSWLGLTPMEFELVEGQWMNLGNLPLAPHGSLQGRCQDCHGRPLLGARVRLRHPELLRPLETSSDEVGHYRFPLTPLGTCQVELLPPLGFPGLGQRLSIPLNMTPGGGEQALALTP